MVRLRGKFLSCFYCGRRSTIKFDGHIREFECTYCEATNYLDENGEITDPPALEPKSPKQYAVASRATSPAISSDGVFCETCLKNQRLFTASLAQYLPDDPSHPDYAELERRYYRFRRDLEKRYPQVCADCAGEVEKRMRQARYTAKTDHLRRMVEKSRDRKVPTRTTALDVANAAGRWLWWAGLLAQVVWHLVHVARALEQNQHHGMRDADEQRDTFRVIAARLVGLLDRLPDADSLMVWSIAAGVLSAWWNPHFVQVNRGFTRHLVGFGQWYSFQCLIVFLRYLFRAVVAMRGGKAQSQQAQLSVHFAMATMMSFIYSLAKRSIKVDTAPLFGPPEKDTLPSVTEAPTREMKKSMIGSLDEALDSVAVQTRATQRNPALWQTPHKLPPQSRVINGSAAKPSPQKAEKTQLEGPDEMDWSPIPPRSAHRAFQQPTPGTKSGSRLFSQSPTQPKAGTFWYKVPAAPVNPAQRLRNPPNAPFLRRKQEQEVKEDRTPRFESRRAEDEARPSPKAKVDFQQPSFFAPEQPDEANALADVFSSSFSLSQEQEEEQLAAASEETPCEPPPYGLWAMAALFPSWLVMSLTAVPFRKELQLASLGAAGLVAALSTGRGTAMMSAFGVAEMGAVGWALWQLWTVEDPLPWYGLGTLGVMLGRQLWGYFM